MGADRAHFNGSWPSHPVLRNTPHHLSFPALMAGLIALAGLPACAPTVDKRGNLPEPDKLAEIRPGATTRDEVSKILGTPSSISVFNEKTWYYISRRTK